MYTPGWTSQDFRDYVSLLLGSHSMRTEAYLMDINHNYLQNLSGLVVGGQVNISAQAEVTRSGSIDLYDPFNSVQIDTDSPINGANYYTKMVQIWHSIWGPETSEAQRAKFRVPVFTGPIADFSRSGSYLSLALLGKEKLADHQVWNPVQVFNGRYKHEIIEWMMRERSGENYFEITPGPTRYGADYIFDRPANLWDEIQEAASSMGFNLFYNGAGFMCLRPYSDDTVYEFRDGQGGSILTEPQIKYDDTNQVNVVQIVTPLAASISVLPGEHPLNHERIGRVTAGPHPGRKPRHFSEIRKIEDPIPHNDALAIGNGVLADLAAQQLKIDMEVLAVPILEEGDMVRITKQNAYSFPIRMKETSIPLLGARGSFGTVRNLDVKTKKVA